MDAAAMLERLKLSINDPDLADRGYDYINLGQAKLEPLTWWRHLERHPPYQFRVRAPYTTGTVTMVQDSAAVVGVGTAFDDDLHVGQPFQVSGDNEYYFVSAIADGTHLTLGTEYKGSSVSGSAYSIYNVSYQLPDTLSGHKIKSILLQNPHIDLTYVDEDEWSAFFPNLLASTGQPTHYTDLSTRYVHMMPAPSADYVAVARMQKIPRSVSSSQTVLDWPEMMHEALLKLAIAEGFRDRGDNIADDIESEAMGMAQAFVRQNNKKANSNGRLKPFDYSARKGVYLRNGLTRVSGDPVP